MEYLKEVVTGWWKGVRLQAIAAQMDAQTIMRDHVPSVGQQNIDIRASNAINVMIVPAYVMGDAEGTAEYTSMAINTVHTCMRTIAVLRSNLLIMTASDN